MKNDIVKIYEPIIRSKIPDPKQELENWPQLLIQEVNKMTEKLKDQGRELETVDRPKYGAETFGTGEGVRKDTYIPPAEGGDTSVAEVRSDLAIDDFLKAQ